MTTAVEGTPASVSTRSDSEQELSAQDDLSPALGGASRREPLLRPEGTDEVDGGGSQRWDEARSNRHHDCRERHQGERQRIRGPHVEQ